MREAKSNTFVFIALAKSDIKKFKSALVKLGKKIESLEIADNTGGFIARIKLPFASMAVMQATAHNNGLGVICGSMMWGKWYGGNQFDS